MNLSLYSPYALIPLLKSSFSPLLCTNPSQPPFCLHHKIQTPYFSFKTSSSWSWPTSVVSSLSVPLFKSWFQTNCSLEYTVYFPISLLLLFLISGHSHLFKSNSQKPSSNTSFMKLLQTTPVPTIIFFFELIAINIHLL